MKKLFYPLFALAAMAMTNTSCSDELENGAIANGNEATVSFKVQLENAIGSRLAGDGKTAKELHYAVYKVTDDEKMPAIGNEIEALRGAFITDAEGNVTDKTVKIGDDLTAEVKLTLVKGQTYNFLFWAQCEGGNKYYTVNYETGTIDLIYDDKNDDDKTDDILKVETAANDENRDAFFKVRKNLKVNGPIEETITLKRPFAQVNVGTEIGSLKDAQTAEVTIETSEFVVDNVATRLDTYSGAVSTPKADGSGDWSQVKLTFTKSAITESNHTDKEGDLKDVEQKNYEHLAMNYILVDDQNGQTPDGSQQAIINATFSIYGTGGNEAGKPINTFTIPNIPVQRNWRTNIIGDIMNETVTFNIVVDPKFDNDHNYFTEKKLAYAFANGGEITIPRNADGTPMTITLTEPLVLDNPDNFVTINLNGATITGGLFAEYETHKFAVSETAADNTDSYPFYVKAGTLNIKGEGKIQAQDCTYSIAVFAAGGTVNIYGGEYTNAGDGCDLIYAKYDGATVNIYGGYFKATDNSKTTAATKNDNSALNIRDEHNKTAFINVYGGKFYNFNPADNVSEVEHTNFVADGYAVKKDGDDYEVVEYSEVFAGTDDLTLYSDVKADATIALAAGQDLNGDGKTLEMEKSKAQYAITAAGGKIEDLTIKGYNTRNAEAKVTRGIYISKPTENVEIAGVNISGVAYPLNTGTKATVTGLTLTVNNCTLVGWSSWDGGFASATFTGCTFGVGTYFTSDEDKANHWNGMVRPYIDTVFDGCDFEEGFKVDVYFKTNEGTSSEKTYQPNVTFKNCKYKGVPFANQTELNVLFENGDDLTKVSFEAN